MTDWFANKGQIIQASAAVLCSALALANYVQQSGGVALVAACLVLMVITLFSFWLTARAVHLRRRSLYIRLFQRANKLGTAYRELVRRFPNSEAVASPWSTAWRPSVGETAVPSDQDKVIDWANEMSGLLTESGFIFEESAEILGRLRSSHSTLEVINALCELQMRILRRIDSSLEPAL